MGTPTTQIKSRVIPLVITALSLLCLCFLSDAFAQVDISIGGNTQVTGDLSISGAGKGLIFPDSTKQTTAGQRKYVSTIVVSPAATDTDSGTALRNAIAGISDASETTPYLIKIEPGVYDIGSSALQMKSYVDVEGSGETVTKITGLVIGSSTGVVVTANNMELRFVTVESGTTLFDTIAIYNPSGSPRLTHVTAIIRAPLILSSEGVIGLKDITGPLPSPTERSYGIYNNAVSAKLTEITVIVAGTKEAYGIYNKNCNSYLEIRGAVTDAYFASYCYGLYNNNSSPWIVDTSSRASQGTSCYGIYNHNSSEPKFFNVVAEARVESTNSYGIYNYSSSPILINVIARAVGGTAINRGMSNGGSAATVRADRCSFEVPVAGGTNHSVYNDADFTLHLGACKLSGNRNTSTGTWRCTQCYDGDYYGVSGNCSTL